MAVSRKASVWQTLAVLKHSSKLCSSKLRDAVEHRREPAAVGARGQVLGHRGLPHGVLDQLGKRWEGIQDGGPGRCERHAQGPKGERGWIRLDQRGRGESQPRAPSGQAPRDGVHDVEEVVELGPKVGSHDARDAAVDRGQRGGCAEDGGLHDGEGCGGLGEETELDLVRGVECPVEAREGEDAQDRRNKGARHDGHEVCLEQRAPRVQAKGEADDGGLEPKHDEVAGRCEHGPAAHHVLLQQLEEAHATQLRKQDERDRCRAVRGHEGVPVLPDHRREDPGDPRGEDEGQEGRRHEEGGLGLGHGERSGPRECGNSGKELLDLGRKPRLEGRIRGGGLGAPLLGGLLAVEALQPLHEVPGEASASSERDGDDGKELGNVDAGDVARGQGGDDEGGNEEGGEEVGEERGGGLHEINNLGSVLGLSEAEAPKEKQHAGERVGEGVQLELRLHDELEDVVEGEEGRH
mmetsp:Transcript_21354/g.51447  ORF Transcript_21354/g.51447 Transcript_21354/m.51447 type:complete len:465 (+) Transcript_21354:90-1484(+)